MKIKYSSVNNSYIEALANTTYMKKQYSIN